jgi:hypothetical protein
VSKERARRRAEREAAAERARAREARRAGLLRWVRLPRLGRRPPPPAQPSPAGRRPPSSALGRHRRKQNGLLLAVLLPLNAVYWLVQPAWPWRLGALAATVIAWPLLVVVLFDRRASR